MNDSASKRRKLVAIKGSWDYEAADYWPVKKLSFLCRYIGSGTTPDTKIEEYFGNGAPWVTTGELREGVIKQTIKQVSPAALHQYSALKLHPAGTVLMAMYGGTIGRLGMLGIAATTNQACCALVPNNGSYSQFLMYWLAAFTEQIVNLSDGGGQPNINMEKIASLRVATPPYAEQKTIAAFLDYETAKIDALIAKQQRLIELLKEKRQAVISHAVTKGLNPNAPMKDSGVEWLGEVPEHWLSSRLTYYAEVGNGSTPKREHTDYWENGDIPWLNSSKVNDGDIASAEQFVTPKAVKECHLPWVENGSLLMAITGQGKTRGMVARMRMGATINQHVASIQISREDLNSDFLYWYLKSQYGRIRFESSDGGSTKAAITCDEITRFPVPVPPRDEQQEIIRFVETQDEKLASLSQKSNQQITFLKERRSALISAAVTGKIDVRGWQPPANTQQQ